MFKKKIMFGRFLLVAITCTQGTICVALFEKNSSFNRLNAINHEQTR